MDEIKEAYVGLWHLVHHPPVFTFSKRAMDHHRHHHHHHHHHHRNSNKKYDLFLNQTKVLGVVHPYSSFCLSEGMEQERDEEGYLRALYHHLKQRGKKGQADLLLLLNVNSSTAEKADVLVACEHELNEYWERCASASASTLSQRQAAAGKRKQEKDTREMNEKLV
jgi:hypothetical protein